MIRITQRRAPHVSMEAMQSTSRPAADDAFPDTHLTACDLHCSGATQPGVQCSSCFMEWPASRLRRAV